VHEHLREMQVYRSQRSQRHRKDGAQAPTFWGQTPYTRVNLALLGPPIEMGEYRKIPGAKKMNHIPSQVYHLDNLVADDKDVIQINGFLGGAQLSVVP